MQTVLIPPPPSGSLAPGGRIAAAGGSRSSAGGDLSLVPRGEEARFNSVFKRLLRKTRSPVRASANRPAQGPKPSPIEAPAGTPAQMTQGIGLPRGSPPSTGPPSEESPPLTPGSPSNPVALDKEGGGETAGEEETGKATQEAVMDLLEELQLPAQALATIPRELLGEFMSYVQQAASALTGTAGETPGIDGIPPVLDLSFLGPSLARPVAPSMSDSGEPGSSLGTLVPLLAEIRNAGNETTSAAPGPLFVRDPANAQDPASVQNPGELQNALSGQGPAGTERPVQEHPAAHGPGKLFHETIERALAALSTAQPTQNPEPPFVLTPPGPVGKGDGEALMKALILMPPPTETGSSRENGGEASGASDGEGNLFGHSQPGSTTTPPFAALGEAGRLGADQVSVRGVTVHIPTFLQDVAERVALGHVRLSPGQGEMELHLNPPELGRLTVRVALEDGLLKAHFVTPAAEVKQLLESHMAGLRQMLETQGLAIQDLLVSLRERHDRSERPHREEETGTSRAGGGGQVGDEVTGYRLVGPLVTTSSVDYLA